MHECSTCHCSLLKVAVCYWNFGENSSPLSLVSANPYHPLYVWLEGLYGSLTEHEFASSLSASCRIASPSPLVELCPCHIQHCCILASKLPLSAESTRLYSLCCISISWVVPLSYLYVYLSSGTAEGKYIPIEKAWVARYIPIVRCGSTACPKLCSSLCCL